MNDDSLNRYGFSSLILGISMCVISLFIQATQLITEEYVVKNFQIDCQRLVGLEGTFGIVWISVIISVVSFFQCPNILICDTYGYMEDPITGFSEIFRKSEIFICSIVIVMATVFINMNGMILTKHVSAVFSAFMNATRTITVW